MVRAVSVVPVLGRAGVVISVLPVLWSSRVLPLAPRCARSCQHGPSVCELVLRDTAAASLSYRGVWVLTVYTRRKLHIALVFFLFRLWKKK